MPMGLKMRSGSRDGDKGEKIQRERSCMIYEPRSSISPILCTRSLRGEVSSKGEGGGGRQRNGLERGAPGAPQISPTWLQRLGTFSQGVLSSASHFLSPLVTKPFEGRPCCPSTFVFPACVLHTVTTSSGLEFSRIEMISFPHDRISLSEGRGWLLVLSSSRTVWSTFLCKR